MDGLVVPKAALTAAFLRSDSKTTPVSKDDLSQFLTSLDQAVARCSREDVQRCKDWLLKYAVSEGRLEAILKFLTALSKSSADDPRVSSRSAPVSSRKKRLHILYILNDLLHHTKYHESNSEIQTILTNRLESHLLSLVELSASYKLETNRKLHGKLSQLMTLWKDNGYYDKQFIDKLHIIVAHGKVPEDTNRDTPWFLPKTHGDYSTPWYDLPAGNLIPHIIPRSSRPIDPRDVRPLQLKAGPADEELVDAVKKLLQDAEYIYGECDASERGIVDIDNIGQPLVKDEGVGDMVVSDTYYGWSTRFCEQMKRLRRGGPPKDRGRSISRERDRSYSRSLSRSRSRMSSPRKRRRYDSRSLSRSRSRSLRGYASRSRSRSYSSRGSRSRSPRKYRSRSRSPRRYRSRSRSKTPPRLSIPSILRPSTTPIRINPSP
ncbi:hypothetical protein M501DRAFT_544124 [Patellaria atrata CBS 101060]|uniref:CID domain-containing protein n=1 Tax=Patellaria atrata CBS 101060 TaxID=1346257 RepID=A0A9P4SF24_9PEZI|nr:hypothetical protein M501DRAFT_544124 [Patellaria atrata CBS 101060]